MTSESLVNRMKGKAPVPFPELMKRSLDRVTEIVPRHISPERLMRIALVCFRNTPKLAQCDPLSVLSAVLQAAQLGLEPGLSGEAHLIPYGKEAQLIPGYQGLIKLAMNSGQVTSIDAQVVFENDMFELELGLDVKLRHIPLLDSPRGSLRLVYGVARLKDSPIPIVDFMTQEQVYACRNVSAGYKNHLKYHSDTPWIGDTEAEMWRKTMIRRLVKRLPQSSELQTALQLDTVADIGKPQGITIEQAAGGLWEPEESPYTDDTVESNGTLPGTDDKPRKRRGRPRKEDDVKAEDPSPEELDLLRGDGNSAADFSTEPGTDTPF